VPIEVTMPKLSPTMETGVITQWLVKVGDTIKEGDALADIETDKATMQMKAYDDGTVVHIDHAAGEEVALGQRVMVLAAKKEDPAQVAEALGLGKTGAAQAPAAAPAAAQGGAEPQRGADRPSAQTGSPPTAPEPVVESSGNGEQQLDGEDESESEASGRRLKASPLARKMAIAARIDLDQVRGSGPGGRVIRRDIEAYLQSQLRAGQAAAAPAASKAASPPAARAAARAAASSLARAPAAPGIEERIPHTRMRKTIAQRMLEAKQAVPEIHLTVDVRADRLVSAREALNLQLAAEGIKLSLGDFVTKAVALALRIHPGLNATYEPDAIVRHAQVNIGMAVALKEGLIVPVIQNADTLGLREIRLRSEELAAAARANTLKTEQLTGGTFTISNLGMYGTRQFDAIINPPEVAILAVGAAVKQPVVDGDQIKPGTVMSVTLTADHRAVDGAMAAEFLRTLKALLEEPAAMLL
jgi:pyruvate dehydrogenase E2 component (dihydrolipoamide acetyltransferase)